MIDPAVIQIIIIFLSPVIWILLLSKSKIEHLLSPIVMSYATGILLANFNIFEIDPALSNGISQASILAALPLLIYSTDIKKWLSNTQSILICFGLVILAGIISTTLNAFIFKSQVENAWMVSGMLAGVYTGGTPNMQAIGIALEAGEELYVLLNAADIFCSGIYLIFLTSIAHTLLGYILPSYNYNKKEEQGQGTPSKYNFGLKEIMLAGLTTILIIGLSAGLTYIFTGAIENASIIILLLTTFSIVASFVPRVREIEGTFEMGEYLLLVFCVAIGMLTDFRVLIEQGGSIIYFTASVLGLTILIHYLLSALFKIDRDTAMITSTAAVYGPVFIGQVASTIKNRDLVFPGIATSLVGIALGNYIGLAAAYLIRYLL